MDKRGLLNKQLLYSSDVFEKYSSILYEIFLFTVGCMIFYSPLCNLLCLMNTVVLLMQPQHVITSSKEEIM